MRTTLYLPVEREGFGAANPEGGGGTTLPIVMK